MTGETSPKNNSSLWREAARAELTRRGIDWRKPKASPTNLAAYRNDPVGFARDILHAEPWAKQAEIMQAVADQRRVTVRAAHNAGKSWLAAALVHWWARCFDPALVVTTAPTARQVEKVLWREIHKLFMQSGLSGTLTLMQMQVSPTQLALGLTTSEPEKFQGWHEKNILLVVDEASGVEEAIYEALEGCLTGPNAKLLLIGNPNSPQGTFYQSHASALYRPFHLAAADVPEWLLPAGWAEERRQEWGEESPAYQVRVLGEFPDQGDDALIALRWVTAAQEREIDPGATRDDIVVGADIARYGADESVAYVRCGPSVLAGDYWRGQDLVQTAGRIAAFARRYQADRIHVDDIGVGGGVVDALKAARLPVIGVNVGEAAWDSENYFNRRSEIFAGLAMRFKDGDISLPGEDPTLLAQLTALKKGFTPKGQMKLESKDDLRKRLPKMGSPDRADALALAYAAVGPRWQPMAFLGATREAG